MQFDQLKRRELITLVGGAAAWPLMARAQPSVRVRRIGVLWGLAEDDEIYQPYLSAFKQRVQELGWIDLHRFGHEGSGNAIVLAKHSGDLSLMTTILPWVEKDYKNAGEGSVMYAILYDGLQLKLGRKQRYGTQIGVDAEGHPMVLPLEDASKVEQFRKEIGLPPLAEYLKLASEGLYAGKAIRMPRADE